MDIHKYNKGHGVTGIVWEKERKFVTINEGGEKGIVLTIFFSPHVMIYFAAILKRKIFRRIVNYELTPRGTKRN